MPLIAIDELGEAVVVNVVNERKVGEFLSVEDLVKRTKLNKTVMDLLKTYNCVPELSATNQQTLFQGGILFFLKLIENMNAEGKVKEIKLNYDKKDLFGRK